MNAPDVATIRPPRREDELKATPFDWNRRSAEQAFQETLDPSDPRHNEMFRIDLDLGYLDLYWGGYEYSLELDRIHTPRGLLVVLSHVLAKDWEHATGLRVGRLIRGLEAYFQWGLWSGKDDEPLPSIAPRTTSKAQERARLTPTLRYDVLLRDDFRCRACGFSVESGAHLHIDHISPVSAGGRTEINNLQALCSVCNQGKGARK